MSDIPSFPYEILWGEREIVSVANLTRRDGEEFLSLAPTVPVKHGDAYHWEQGLLNETKVTEIARTHAKLALGRRALLTPLAWDRVRSLGLQVVRMKS